MSAPMNAPMNPSMMIDPHAPGVPLSRLIDVELRKLVDTRSARWLLGIMAALLLAAALFGQTGSGASARDMLIALTQIAWIFLGIVAIMLVTGEWSQRSILTTFSLEPRRGRVLTAKAAAIVLLSAVVFALIVALAYVSAATGGESTHGFGAAVQGSALELLTRVALAFAFAMLLLSTPAAISLFFVLPEIAVPLVLGLTGTFDSAAEWVVPRVTNLAFFEGGVEGSDWAQLSVILMLWVVLPGVLGTLRVLTSEVK